MGPRSPVTTGKVELEDVQGIVRSGYGTLPEAVFLILTITDPASAKEWLASAPVTHAAFETQIPRALQVALTAGGLRRIGLSEEALSTFPAEFKSGMGDESRARRLGDLGPSAPKSWTWGGPENAPVDVVAMLYAGAGALSDWRRLVETPAFSAGFHLVRELRTGLMDGREPFGFADGLSQPYIDWTHDPTSHENDEYHYHDRIAPGEAVLGYTNEYGLVTDRPFVQPKTDPRGLLRSFVGDDSRDLGANGSYLVVRQLEQDVSGFWQFLEGVGGSREAAEQLAEKMVGRTRSGTPLSPVESKVPPGQEPSNAFDFDGDPEGIICPLGAHIRRANPRNADVPGGTQSRLSGLLRQVGLPPPGPRTDVTASVRFHRILRRGRKYDPLHEINDTSRGLYFVCLNANIARQFEFIQSAWLESSKFHGLTNESDPIVGSRVPLLDGSRTDSFTCQTDGAPIRIESLPSFVTVRGGAYFFLPGLRALQYLAALS
ncbi:Dyp-type peroxidase [Rhizobium grahamii]|uniref:Peroxidase n=2 Tax=Rhizobium grahamii TaxID=1120045 RepID=S3H9D9_9HYPH|nr:peroxidase [Rhizobium grahamii]EPE94820.1 peroxidase [Rhizobium grahamii CCGE 502]RDJ05609.1 peroxidase [Rhizobium grahamii]